jgi:hypothetical protein
VVEGIVLLRKGAETATMLEGLHAMVQKLNSRVLPKGVAIVPYLDRDDLVRHTTRTVLHNLTEGMILVVVVLFVFLGNIRGAVIVSSDHSVRLAFRLDLSGSAAYFGKPAFAGRPGLRHGGGRSGRDDRKHRAPSLPAG